MQPHDQLADRIHRDPEPECVRAVPQPRPQFVELEMGKREIPQVAVMQRDTVFTRPCEPGGDSGMSMPKHPHRGRDIQSFRERTEHFRTAVRRSFEPIEWGHPEGNGGGH
jgi:hypothetical protein